MSNKHYTNGTLDIEYIYMFISYSHGILLYYDKHYYEYTNNKRYNINIKVIS